MTKQNIFYAFVIALSVSSTPSVSASTPQEQFLKAISSHCGKAYEGQITSNEPKSSTPDAFDGKRLVMHVRGCDDPTQRLEIPFHVGEDRSRTWVLTRTENGLRLKHDHRHEDGSPDAMTMYGGDATSNGSRTRQEFPVDEESVTMFKEGGLTASINNTWAMEVLSDAFVYELSRPNGRLFRVTFDLSKPVSIPPGPWGASTTDKEMSDLALLAKDTGSALIPKDAMDPKQIGKRVRWAGGVSHFNGSCMTVLFANSNEIGAPMWQREPTYQTFEACGKGTYDRELVHEHTNVTIVGIVKGKTYIGMGGGGRDGPKIEIERLFRWSDCLQGDTTPGCQVGFVEPTL